MFPPSVGSEGSITTCASTAAGRTAASVAGTLFVPQASSWGAVRRGEVLYQTAGQSLSFEEKHQRAVDVDLQKGLGPS